MRLCLKNEVSDFDLTITVVKPRMKERYGNNPVLARRHHERTDSA